MKVPIIAGLVMAAAVVGAFFGTANHRGGFDLVAFAFALLLFVVLFTLATSIRNARPLLARFLFCFLASLIGATTGAAALGAGGCAMALVGASDGFAGMGGLLWGSMVGLLGGAVYGWLWMWRRTAALGQAHGGSASKVDWRVSA